jgi:hypothetical protein
VNRWAHCPFDSKFRDSGSNRAATPARGDCTGVFSAGDAPTCVAECILRYCRLFLDQKSKTEPSPRHRPASSYSEAIAPFRKQGLPQRNCGTANEDTLMPRLAGEMCHGNVEKVGCESRSAQCHKCVVRTAAPYAGLGAKRSSHWLYSKKPITTTRSCSFR